MKYFENEGVENFLASICEELFYWERLLAESIPRLLFLSSDVAF